MQPKIENSDYYAFVRRIIRSAERKRTGHIEDLAELAELRTELEQAIRNTIGKLRAEPQTAASWTEIGDALGVSQQAAQQRYGGGDGVRKPGGQPARLR